MERLSLFPQSTRVDAAGRLWLGGCLARDLPLEDAARRPEA